MSVRRMILRWLLKDIAGSVHVMTSSPASAIIGTSHTQSFMTGASNYDHSASQEPRTVSGTFVAPSHTPPHVHHVTVPVKPIIQRILGE